jgi:hypothetical protein
MRKFLLFCFIASAIYAEAQTITPKIGMSLAKVNAEDNTGNKSKPGLSLGVAFTQPIGGIFSFQPELLFIQKGSKLDYQESEPGFYEIDLKGHIIINYLEVPLLLRADFPTNNDAIKVYLNAGPSFAIGLSGKTNLDLYLEFDGEVIEIKDSGKVKFGDEPNNYEGTDAYIKRFDLGAQLGGGVIIKEKFMIDLRYGIGLIDIYDGEKSKNNVFQFTVGMPFPFSK